MRLREMRKNKNLSQEELAETLGISRQSVISLERGEYYPSLPLLLDIVKFFETPFESIVCCEDEELINEEGGDSQMARDITPWSPFKEASSLRDTIDRMFEDSMLGPRVAFIPTSGIPTVNIRETEKSIIVEAELPGVKEEDIDLEIEENSLTIKGEKKSEEEVKEKDFYRREFSYGSFTRTVALPVEVESEKAEASMKEGVLRVELPKLEEAKPKVKKIEIKKK